MRKLFNEAKRSRKEFFDLRITYKIPQNNLTHLEDTFIYNNY